MASDVPGPNGKGLGGVGWWEGRWSSYVGLGRR